MAAVVFGILALSTLSLIDAHGGGFSVELIHPEFRLNKGAEAEIIVDSGEYLLNISLSTPGFDVVAIADTGSDLIWTQCKSCSQCFKQDAPLFDPSKSSTYRKIRFLAQQGNVLESEVALVLMMVFANIQPLMVMDLLHMAMLLPRHSPWVRQLVGLWLFLKQSSVVDSAMAGHSVRKPRR
ncbi:hypothetical protein GQ457_18G013970 [Hibiscus cannabinus]